MQFFLKKIEKVIFLKKKKRNENIPKVAIFSKKKNKFSS